MRSNDLVVIHQLRLYGFGQLFAELHSAQETMFQDVGQHLLL